VFEVEWRLSKSGEKSTFTFKNVWISRTGRPSRVSRSLEVGVESHNFDAVNAWKTVIEGYIVAAKVRREDQERVALAFPAQMALE
jgi:hypothetical protein